MNLNFNVEENYLSGKKLKPVFYGDELFVEKWNQFLDEYPRYSFRYNIETLEYYTAFLNRECNINSFVLVTPDGSPVAACPLVFVDFDGEKYASINDRLPLGAPLFNQGLSEKQLRRSFDKMKEVLFSLFQKEGVKRWYCKAEAITFGLDGLEDTFPAHAGALDASIHHHIIDINVSEEKLKLQLREKARHEINHGLRCYEFKVYDKDTFNHEEIGERYRQLHYKAAGKVTRPLETFTKMNDWILNGNALMYEQTYEGQTVNMTIMALGKNAAYGASTANDREFQAPVPMMQSMMWYIFRDLKERGIEFYDVGRTPLRDTFNYFITEKQKKIAYFKKGFGKRSFPLKIWVWCNTPDEEFKYLNEQIENYKNHLKGEYQNYHA